jgi:plasmid stability protein
MPNVLVRDLPDDVHAALLDKAAARGKSLQQYLTAELRELARRRTVGEMLDGLDAAAGRRAGRVGLRQAVADLDAERARR